MKPDALLRHVFHIDTDALKESKRSCEQQIRELKSKKSLQKEYYRFLKKNGRADLGGKALHLKLLGIQGWHSYGLTGQIWQLKQELRALNIILAFAHKVPYSTIERKTTDVSTTTNQIICRWMHWQHLKYGYTESEIYLTYRLGRCRYTALQTMWYNWANAEGPMELSPVYPRSRYIGGLNG